MPTDAAPVPAGGSSTWHQALAYAVSGRRYPELGHQDRPDLEVVAVFLRGRDDAVGGPYPVPPDLAAGLGPAQLAAAVTELRRRLGLVETDRPRVAGSTGPPDEGERRLLREVPPHHG